MIKVTGRKIYIPQSDKILGFQGDNLCETRCFLITDKNVSGLSFKLDVLEYNCCIDLEKEQTQGGVLLTWNITSSVMQNAGMLNVQLRGFDTQNELVWHSEIETFFVADSVNASKCIEDVALTEFEQIEKRATSAKNEAASFALTAKEYAEKSQGFSENCDKCVKDCEDNVQAFSDIMNTHKQDTSNPHHVTAEQVGACTKIEAVEIVYDVVEDAYRDLRGHLSMHTDSTDNPHHVTAEQVGAYTKQEVDVKIGDISSALDELHAYAQSVISGGEA